MSDPQTWAASSYVRNAPLVYTDPSGLRVVIDPGGGTTICHPYPYGDEQPTCFYYPPPGSIRDPMDPPGRLPPNPRLDPHPPGGGRGQSNDPSVPETAGQKFAECFEKWHLGAIFRPGGPLVGEGNPAGALAILGEALSPIYLGGDIAATAAKHSGTVIGGGGRFGAGGVNFLGRQVGHAIGSRSLVRGVIGPVMGGILGAATLGVSAYDLTIAAQCAAGLLQ